MGFIRVFAPLSSTIAFAKSNQVHSVSSA